jgi:hypothetical protein
MVKDCNKNHKETTLMHLNHETDEIKIRGGLKIKTKTAKKIKTAAAALFWMAGLLIAGSDSPYMPWLNGMGILMFSGISLVSGQWLSRLDRADSGKALNASPPRPEVTPGSGWKKAGWDMKSPWRRDHLSAGEEKIQGRIFSKI